MIVEVILGEVGEDGAVEPRAVDPMLIQTVGRDFHGRRPNACLDHPRQQAMEVGGFGRGPVERDGPARDPHAGRADHAGRHPRGLEHGFEQIGGGRLPVGSGRADQCEAIGGVAEERRRHRAHRPADRRNDDLHAWEIQWLLDHQHGGPCRDRAIGELVPVHARSRNTEEQRAGPDLRGAIGDVGNQDARVSLDPGIRGRGDQLYERRAAVGCGGINGHRG